MIISISESISQNQFTIYVQENRYDITLSENYGFYQFMGEYYIDRAKKQNINYENVDQGIKRFYPYKYDKGFLSIDLENKIYHDMRLGKKDDPSTKIAVNQFVHLVEYIKKKRPNVKVGIYGVPFNFNYDSQKSRNNFEKLAPLLKVVDYISPSLYLSYSENERKSNYVIKYIEDNLTLFLDYATIVDKPVYPYVWYRVHPSNKKYGSELISKQWMDLYLKTIRNFEFDGKKVSGIIWWEPSNSVKMLQIKNRYPAPFATIEEILFKYTNNLK